jgi:putative SOS response-associated peptidase YedK
MGWTLVRATFQMQSADRSRKSPHNTVAGRVGGKTPYYFRLKDGSPFAFAGLWEKWDKGEEPVESCTLITTEANGVVGPVHHRMPVIPRPIELSAMAGPERAASRGPESDARAAP